jgi:hypothetical protein
MTKNGVEFLMGCRDFPLDKDDTWEPITNLPGSEHKIVEFQKYCQEEYKIKTVEELQSVFDKRNTHNERLFSSQGIVKSDLWGRSLDNTGKKAPQFPRYGTCS